MKNFIIPLSFVLCVIGMIWLYDSWKTTQREYNQLYDTYQVTLANRNDEPLVIRDTIIDTVAGTVTYMYHPTRTTGPIEGYVSKGLADTLATALGVATKKIDRLESKLVTVEARAKGERTTDTVTQIQWLTMRDPVFDVRVNLTNDSIFPKARIKLDQAYAPYRKNIFSPWEYRSVVRASDPRVQISEIRDVTKVPRSSRWGIGFSAGPVITPERLTYGIMFGINFDLIQR